MSVTSLGVIAAGMKQPEDDVVGLPDPYSSRFVEEAAISATQVTAAREQTTGACAGVRQLESAIGNALRYL